MKNEQEYIDDIREIRTIMERSTRFISLSGLSGIAAGIYALAGAFIAYRLIYAPSAGMPAESTLYGNHKLIWQLAWVAAAVLVLTLATGIWLSYLKSKREGKVFWGRGSKQFLAGVSTPLVAGGIFIILMIVQGYFTMVAPAFLVFYGLALIHGGRYTESDIQWPGYLEIILGLTAAAVPQYGLLLWAAGFGILHIIYGIIMSLKYGL